MTICSNDFFVSCSLLFVVVKASFSLAALLPSSMVDVLFVRKAANEGNTPVAL